jgi:hypothetical protein
VQEDLIPPAIVRHDVNALVREIKTGITELEICMATGAELALKLGQLCIRLKEAVGHGAWGSFVRLHLERSLSTVERWMRLAKSSPVTNLEEQWRIICGKYEDEPPANSADSNTPKSSPVTNLIQCRPCRVHGPKPNCKDCQALGEERAKKDTPTIDPEPDEPAASQEQDRPPEPQRRNREPGDDDGPPNPHMEGWRPLAKKINHRIDEMQKHLTLSKTEVQSGRERANGLGEWFEQHCTRPERPIEKPVKKNCRDCHIAITLAMTANHAWVPLVEAPRGGAYDIVDGVACNVKEGGPYKMHLCPKRRGQSVLNGPIPE